ncbi:MAG TPA: AraC family transcriptional regulator [Lachnospiraceae bacterium]|nr:AraC family transcriptional regulator [Lachnospiraceae bacterium]
MFFCLDPIRLPRVCLINSTTIEPPYIHRRRKSDEFIVYIIKSGIMYLKENGIKYTLIPGDIFVLDPEYVHEGYEASYCEYYYIHFKHDSIWREVKELSQDSLISIRNRALQSNSFSYDIYESTSLMVPKYYHFKNQSSYIQLQYILNEAVEENKTQLENYKVKTSCKVLEAFVHIERCYISGEIDSSEQGAAKSLPKVQDILNFINSDYAQCLSSSMIEEKFQCNFDYINRIFKKVTGNTIFSYLNRVRIDHAKVLLLTTSLKTAEIGERVGFSDIYYFSKVFKKHTGVSPTAFGKGIA